MKTVVTHAAAVVVGILIALGLTHTTANPSLSVMGLPSVISGHVSVGIHSSSPVIVTHSDNVDTSCDGHAVCAETVMDVSVDGPGPASITVVAVNGNRVSKPFEWQGTAK